MQERADLEAALARRDRLLQGLADASRELLALRGDDEREAMTRVLGRLGEAAEVERAYVFENGVDRVTGEPTMRQVFEWTAPGIASFLDDPKLQDLPYSVGPGWYEALSQRRPTHLISRLLEGPIQAIMQEQGILALIKVPIFVGELFWGFVGFDSCTHERAWAPAEVDALRAFAETLGTALTRRRLEAEIVALSNPAVQIWERTLLVPLHGALDAGRLAAVTRTLLAALHERRASHVLLDVTAVVCLGPELAPALQRLVDAAALLGARCVLVGVSAGAAQALAAHADGLRRAAIRATLQDGLILALAEQGLAVGPAR